MDNELEAIVQQIKDNQRAAPYLSEWRHVKTGGIYAVRMHVIIEATLEPAVVYYKKYDVPEVTWCRPAAEFFDGRFTQVFPSLAEADSTPG